MFIDTRPSSESIAEDLAPLLLDYRDALFPCWMMPISTHNAARGAGLSIEFRVRTLDGDGFILDPYEPEPGDAVTDSRVGFWGHGEIEHDASQEGVLDVITDAVEQARNEIRAAGLSR